MRQIFHIFKKDVRRHWIEILFSTAALTLYTWHEIHSWKPKRFDSLRFWPATVFFLLFIAWWVLIVRLIQGESLAGDRQFWTTRPCEWKCLLAAKASFILAFVNVPLAIAQVFLLLKAGFPPTLQWFWLLWLHLLMLCVPLSPIMALATVTRNISQSLLALLGVVLLMAGLLAFTLTVGEPAFAYSADWLMALVLAIVSVMAIGLQYVRRKTSIARIILGIGGGMIVLITTLVPSLTEGMDIPAFSGTTELPSLQAELLPQPLPQDETLDEKDKVEVVIPMAISGLPKGFLAQGQGVMLTARTPDGGFWRSKWIPVYQFFLPGTNNLGLNFSIERKIFEKIRFAPAAIEISFATKIFQSSNEEVVVVATDQTFPVPRTGMCWLDSGYRDGIKCLAPFFQPVSVFVRVEPSESTCPIAEGGRQSKGELHGWQWATDTDFPDYGFSPVQSFGFDLTGYDGKSPERALICPGSPLHFSFPQFIRRTRAEFKFNGIKLEQYRYVGLGFHLVLRKSDR